MDNEEKTAKVYDFIKGNLINLIVILTSFAYIFYGLVDIEETTLTVWECVAKAGIGVIIGFIIKQSMGENGFNYGYRSNIWKTNLDKYQKACNLANDYIDNVDNFYACEEVEKKKEYRRVNMMAFQMRYSWFFDEIGNYKENPEKFDKLTKKQKKMLKKCISVKIYNLNLFSEYSNETKTFTQKEKTDKDQRGKMFAKNGLVQIATAVVGTYFVASWGDWDWGSLIIASIQVLSWLATGVVQLYTNYNYVAIEKVNKLTRKIELIIKFKKGCENGLYKTNPYDDYERKLIEEEEEIKDGE